MSITSLGCIIILIAYYLYWFLMKVKKKNKKKKPVTNLNNSKYVRHAHFVQTNNLTESFTTLTMLIHNTIIMPSYLHDLIDDYKRYKIFSCNLVYSLCKKGHNILGLVVLPPSHKCRFCFKFLNMILVRTYKNHNISISFSETPTRKNCPDR